MGLQPDRQYHGFFELFTVFLVMLLFYGCSEKPTSTRRQYSIAPRNSSVSGQQTTQSPFKLVFLSPQEDLVGRGLVEIEVQLINPPKNATLGFYFIGEASLEAQQKDIEQVTGDVILDNLEISESLIEWDQTDLDADIYYVYAEVTSKMGTERFILDASFEVRDSN